MSEEVSGRTRGVDDQRERGSRADRIVSWVPARTSQVKPAHILVGVAVLGLVVMGSGILLYATTPRGPGIEPDSVSYLSTAESLTRGAGYIGYEGQIVKEFPPGYPLVLALGRLLTGAAAVRVAEVVDILLFAGLVLGTYLLARRLINNPWLRLLATASVTASPALLFAYSYAMSETIFNFLCMAALLLVCRMVQSPPISPVRYRALLGLLALITAMACLTRISGVALWLSLAVTVIVLNTPARPLIVRAAESLGFSVVALAPIALWDVYLHSQTGNWSLGSRPPPTTGIGGNIVTAGQTLAGWLTPPSTILPVDQWLDILVGLVVVAAVAIALRQLVRLPSSRLRTIAPVFIFCVTYPLVLLAISSRVIVQNDLDDRHLSPFLAPLFVLLAFAIELAWVRSLRSKRLGQALALALTGAVSLSLVSSMVVTGRNAGDDHANGVSGATSTDWTNMSIYRTALNLPHASGQILLSNAPEQMSYSSGRTYHYPPSGDDDPAGVDDLRSQIAANGPAYLVVFSGWDNPSLYTPDELSQWFTVRVVYSSDDGQIAELKLKP